MNDLKLNPEDQVEHVRFGLGVVEFPKIKTVIVRFDHGLEECTFTSLIKVINLSDAINAQEVHSLMKVVTRAQSLAIQSVNDSWGVFSRSRISLLPHQLWVCNQVLKQWPARYLVADDVGLGKTIEAGLILWPLLSKKLVKRVLIICPASLVEQWQFRMREMFDIRFSRYTTEADTPRSDFWNTHVQVIASLPTIREDRNGRHNRMLEAEPWDLLIVDEAHHLNAYENGESTQGYQLVNLLMKNEKVQSSIFFTGTPHRGKSWGFWAMLHLLRPDLFNPKFSDQEQLVNLKEVMIRNNKALVTDMQGNKLFKPVKVFSEVFAYNEEEEHFYALMTDFIEEGKAYATSLTANGQSRVMLVLIAMQKLASSSVAAISKALKGRLERLTSAQGQLKEKLALSNNYSGLLMDEAEKHENMLAEARVALMEEEIPNLEALVDAADKVLQETKISKIMEILDNQFKDQSVLFFTEYKATQASLMTALMKKYGQETVSFINGDECLNDLELPDGRFIKNAVNRADVADFFNAGKIRFLISTEAGGEGIDLQERCHSLVHVDLPWNPMRLHQRVGRLNRYGQKYPVKVMTIRNPHTVESRIWDKLNTKLELITEALGSGMEDPEDMLQLVLGMSSENIFTELFSAPKGIKENSLDNWFDEKTQSLGGSSAIDKVKSMVGNVTKFDLHGLKDIPDIDLPALRPFFENMLHNNKRRIQIDEGALSFKTPDAWRTELGIRKKYEGLVFDRTISGRHAAESVIGVGHKVFDKALSNADDPSISLAYVPGNSETLIIFSIYDQVTEQSGHVKKAVAGVQCSFDLPLENWGLLKDWHVVNWLNGIEYQSGDEEVIPEKPEALEQLVVQAEEMLKQNLEKLGLPFEMPVARPVILLSGYTCGN